MRTLALLGITMVTAFGAGAADAQRLEGGQRSMPGASYPVPGQMPRPVTMQPPMMQPQMPRPPMMSPPMLQPPMLQPGRPNPGQSYPSQPYPGQTYPSRAYPGQSYPGQSYPNGPSRQPSRWGGSTNGRWSGGMNAPGGWNAYHRPSRGYRVPRYWTGGDFFIGDYAGYGLSAPPQGYRWSRYYDDAVLLDRRGRVYDSVAGLNWDGGYDGYGSSDGYGYTQGGYVQHYAEPLPPVVQNGAVTTYSTGGGYAQGGYGGSGYAYGGYYYPGATTTVVTIQGAPSVTTTTTEYVEETRTRYIAPRRVYHAPKRVVRCGCVRPRARARVVERPILGS